MGETNDPVRHFKKVVDGKVETKYAHNAKEARALEDAGWTDDTRSLEKIQYPCLVYGKEGSQVECRDEDHWDILKGDGYSKKPVLAKVAVGTGTPESPSTDKGRIDSLEESVAELKQGMKDILDALGGGNTKTKKSA